MKTHAKHASGKPLCDQGGHIQRPTFSNVPGCRDCLHKAKKMTFLGAHGEVIDLTEEEFTVDYEGMGTCIAATILKSGKPICTISAYDPKNNDFADRCVNAALRTLRGEL